MSDLSIVYYPDPVLRKKAAPVTRITPEIISFAEAMLETMYASNGAGLAAPQVGVSLRLIVVDVDGRPHLLVNPQIVSREGSQTGVEGCLSLPNLHGDVTRAQKVVVQATNLRGKKVTLSGEGMWARAMQHETDHLDGVVFTDRVIPESLHWVTGEQDAEGNLIERATSLEDALAFFERRATLTRA